jgi:Na+/H+-dicarboxylate symporter
MIVDMARTATNVVGAAESAVLVAKTEGLLQEDVYNGTKEKGEHHSIDASQKI